jgi:cytosine deaminase
MFIQLQGPEDYLRTNGVELTILQDQECIEMMQTFIRENPALWDEDIGV